MKQILRLTCISIQSCSEVYESSITWTVLVRVPVVPRKDLPSQPAATVICVPSQLLTIPYSLRQRQPLRLVAWRIREFILGRSHGSHTPERLIVVSFVLGLIGRHVVPSVGRLEHHTFGHNLIKAGIAGVVPIVHQNAEECTSLPPVVGRRENAGNAIG